MNDVLVQQILDSIQDGISVLDKDFNIVWTNKFIHGIYAQNAAIVGRKCYHAFLNEDKICEDCPAKRCFETGEVHKSILPFITPRGNEGWIELSVHPIKNKDGEVIRVIEYIKDITEYKKSRELVELLKDALDHVEDGVYLVAEDAKFIYVNYAASWFLNYPKEYMERMYVYDINSQVPKEHWAEHWQEVKEAKTLKFESTQIRQDGSVFPVEISINYIEYDSESYHLTFVQDITKRVHNQEELRLLNYALEHLNDAYFLIDETSRILHVNHAASSQLGYTKDELIGLSLGDIGHNFRMEVYLEHWNRLKNKERLTFEVVHKRKDGSIFPVQVNANFIKYHNKEYNLAFVHDITERKMMMKALQQSQDDLKLLNGNLQKQVAYEVAENRKKDQLILQQSKMASLGEMISNIAHQWRQPISTIGMITQNILQKFQMGQMDEAYLVKKTDDMMHQIDYMSETINDFRYFFSPNKNKKEFDIKEQIKYTLNFMDHSLKSSNITIIFEAEDTLPYQINGYSNEMSQVLLNILKNAKDVLIERKTTNPHIKIKLQQVQNKVQLSIQDNGGGIDSTIIDKVFEPYFSTKGPDVGTGIGLYMSKTIIETHMNGSIEVYNTPEGACFLVTLPIDEK